MSEFAVILDGMMALLLLVTIAYCMTLHRRLAAMRDGEAEMRALLAGFTEAIKRAEVGIAKLKGASEAFRRQIDERVHEVDGELKSKFAAARTLIDELSVMTRSAESLADRLEQGIDGGRTSVRLSGLDADDDELELVDRQPEKPAAKPAGDEDDDEWEEDGSLMDELEVRSEVERELLLTLRQAK